jgi:hypothetical protein
MMSPPRLAQAAKPVSKSGAVVTREVATAFI